MAEVFELHDRSRVEVYGFDYSDTTPSPMRQRVMAAFDHHEPVHELADVQVAQRIRELEIDVLIDLTGLTASSPTRSAGSARATRRAARWRTSSTARCTSCRCTS